MNYFALQVRTRREDKYIFSANRLLEHRFDRQHLIFPKRKLLIRRKGISGYELRPIFPGYVFIQTELIDGELFNILRTTKDFFRFLKNNSEICPLKDKDLTILQHFVRFNGIAEVSTLSFDKDDRIVVKSGPMEGLEGLIVKVDKRKKRAKIALDFANEKFLIDLAFDILQETSDEKK